MGRKRKKLIEKSTSIIFRIDNETLFKLCDILQIKYDENAEILDDSTKNALNVEIKKIVHEFVK
ncbi:hypothetical protein MKX53_19660 [Psychrobacillus sp. FSL K6-4615]|uniref:hypothetical protein n=1 Tax=Psychrobacillus sp. FSL K6-4615 TaxID=2921551 RepID=UPI0030F95A6A